ncbi:MULTISPECIES: hypothetical protein [unclassified Halobacteriovorax]|uniref:hypothetical protein n=1 Tax=unclassified Halobacteriovorax TaxID=2639665 RepID=UPI002FF2FF10
MQFLKFSILFLTINSVIAFTGTECFQSSFDVSVSHKSSPFGLLNKTLTISKKECEVEVAHNEYKYHNRSWVIDICRDPVHIKSTTTSIDVYRKAGECHKTSNDFCDEYKTIRKIIEDDGLIFAEGAKNNLNDPHGRVFCASLVLNAYLKENNIFNRNGNYDSLMIRKPIARIPEDIKKARAEFKAEKETKVETTQDKAAETEVEESSDTSSDGLEIDENAGPGTF